ncbi:hypothetical protein CC78DRAFT_577968 [Lojkania enalia]|uniref:Uncharacterized protein n=1 Tax=Lojkania enalia TaxID=147567 RepID=A0A9P4KDG7_9PLEO|nr:hypothetical protein CC78DRAFT_577968 [Didymosphaeria enalia]
MLHISFPAHVDSGSTVTSPPAPSLHVPTVLMSSGLFLGSVSVTIIIEAPHVCPAPQAAAGEAASSRIAETAMSRRNKRFHSRMADVRRRNGVSAADSAGRASAVVHGPWAGGGAAKECQRSACSEYIAHQAPQKQSLDSGGGPTLAEIVWLRAASGLSALPRRAGVEFSSVEPAKAGFVLLLFALPVLSPIAAPPRLSIPLRPATASHPVHSLQA